MGAKGTMIGRSFIYGLGAMGQAGVAKALELLKAELDISMALCGVRHARDIGPEHVLVPEDFEGRWTQNA